MIPETGLTEDSPNIILYPRLINTTKGKIIVYTEAEHKENSPESFEETVKREYSRRNSTGVPNKYPCFVRLADGNKKEVKSQLEEDGIMMLLKGGIPVLGNTTTVQPMLSQPTAGAAALMLVDTPTVTVVEAKQSQVAPQQPAQEKPKRKAGRPKK